MWKLPTNWLLGEKKPDAPKPDTKKTASKKPAAKPAVKPVAKKTPPKAAPKKPLLSDIPKIDINKDQLLADSKRIGLKYAKKPLVWVAVISAIIYLAIEMPGWQRKANLYEVINSGRAGYICLSHENSVFERSSMTKAYNTTKTYIRFDRATFIKDFLKRDATAIKFLAAAVDVNGGVYWSEMTLKENLKLSKQFNIELGTCLSANGIHYQVPGAAYVTNQ